VLKVKRGEHVGHPGVHYVQLKKVTIDGRAPIALNVEGEFSDARHIVYRARSRDLYVHVANRPGEEED
jgi:diacylglycerol kinase family enzyme